MQFSEKLRSTLSIPWCKKVKHDQTLKSRQGGPAIHSFLDHHHFFLWIVPRSPLAFPHPRLCPPTLATKRSHKLPGWLQEFVSSATQVMEAVKGSGEVACDGRLPSSTHSSRQSTISGTKSRCRLFQITFNQL